MNTPTLLPRPSVPLSAIAAQSERTQREAKEATARADLARDIAEREPVASPLFKRQDFPGHRHYAVFDDGRACITVHTFAASGGDVVAMTMSSGNGEHYTAQRFSPAIARALAAELLAAADSLEPARGAS